MGQHSAITLAKLLELQLDQSEKARIDLLADKEARGELTPAEDSQYRALVETIDLLGILRAEVRKPCPT